MVGVHQGEKYLTSLLYAFIGILGITRAGFFQIADSNSTTGFRSPFAKCSAMSLETVVDLVAWPVAFPDKFATALGLASGPGTDQAKTHRLRLVSCAPTPGR
jgi:hypothetical protein